MTGTNIKRFFVVAQLIFFGYNSLAWAQFNLPLGERYAVILGGIGGQEEFTKKYYSQTRRMYNILVDTLEYKRENIFYLFEVPSYDSLKIQYRATAVNVRRLFNQLAKTMTPKDQLFIFMVGHGTYDGDWSKFNLVGPDLRDIDFARLLAEIPTKKIIIVNTTSASGPFIEKLSGKERVIITATKSGAEYHATTFADFFLDALATEEADFNKDNRISLFEAFKFAKANQDTWYEEKRRLRAEHPLLDDNGDGKGTQELDNGTDGLWASRVYLGPISSELEATFEKVKTGTYSPVDSLRLKKFHLEQEIEDLKAQKKQMKSDEYFRKLESLLIQLAKVNKQLKKSK
ncbi:MAG: C13 family peptidase [bacterium]